LHSASRPARVRDVSVLKKVAEVRVLYADTDQMGVVNNVHYLRFFEVGRAEWIRTHGRSYKEIEGDGYLLPVVEAQLHYRASARYDDLIMIAAGPEAVRAATVTFRYALYRGGDEVLLCEGYTKHACVGADGRVKRFPPALLAMLQVAP
jgi:acyl-CoA thioester hydrolase